MESSSDSWKVEGGTEWTPSGHRAARWGRSCGVARGRGSTNAELVCGRRCAGHQRVRGGGGGEGMKEPPAAVDAEDTG